MLPEDNDESPHAGVHTPVQEMQTDTHFPEFIRIQKAMHDRPNDMWMKIIGTQKIYAGSHFFGCPAGHKWFRFPARNMNPLSDIPSDHFQSTTVSITDYHGRQICPEPDGTFIVFHMVQTSHLVSSHNKAPGSSGILLDSGMRYGSDHGDGIGVYAYASPPYELFSLGDQWCLLELKVRPYLTRVKGGSRGRYLLKSDQSDHSIGAPCTDCEVMAMLHMYSTLPSFMKF